MRRVLIMLFYTAMALGGCATAPAPPTQAEVQAMYGAVKPSNPEVAQRAVRRFFEPRLFDAPAALYKFPLPPVQGSRTFGKERQFGWFICGELNGKNRMGGYTGYSPFLVFFSPTNPDMIEDSLLGDTDDYAAQVRAACKGLYGQ